MDEPFTGLDPVNVMLLREAFLELRDRGRTVVFSTHQMEVAEALCESVAIVDRGRMVVGGPLRDVRRSTGRRLVRISVERRPPAAVAGGRARDADHPARRGADPVELDAGTEPERCSRRRSRPARVSSTSRSPTRRWSRCSSTTSAGPPTRTRTSPPPSRRGDADEPAAAGRTAEDAA